MHISIALLQNCLPPFLTKPSFAHGATDELTRRLHSLQKHLHDQRSFTILLARECIVEAEDGGHFGTFGSHSSETLARQRAMFGASLGLSDDLQGDRGEWVIDH